MRAPGDVLVIGAEEGQVGWADVATKQDLEHLRIATKSEIDQLRAHVKTDISDLRAELKGDVSDLRADLKGDVADLRGDLSALHGAVAGLAGRIDGMDESLRQTVAMFAAEIRVDFQRHINRLVYVMVPALFTSIGLSAGVAAAIAR